MLSSREDASRSPLAPLDDLSSHVDSHGRPLCVSGGALFCSDLHFGSGNLTIDWQTVNSMRSVLKAEMPDLVVLSGDAVSGW